MATDPNIRNLFRSDDNGGTPGGSKLNVDTIIRRSRARRLPRQVAFGGVFTLALGGVVVAGVQGFGALGNQPASTLAGGSQADSSAPEAGPSDNGILKQNNLDETIPAIKRAPAEKINLCGGTLADVAPSQTGLVVEVKFDDSVKVGKKATPIDGTATLTNTGTETLTGYTSASPAVTLSQDGIVLWHTNGAMIMVAVDVNLAPGESMEYPVSFTPVTCTVDDDLELSFSDDLPVVEPGEYQLSAALDFMGDFDADLVTGPLSDITIK